MLASCLDLEQYPKSQLTNDDFYKTDRQVASAIGPIYNGLENPAQLGTGDNMMISATDQVVTPTRDYGGWYDNGVHLRTHSHTWTTTEVNGIWLYAFKGVNACNRLLYQIEQIEDTTNIVSYLEDEIRAVRAYYYFIALDYYGRVPIVKDYDVPENFAPANNSRDEVYAFVKNELEATAKNLPMPGMENYGRMHRMAAYTLLAKVYLNSLVFSGEDPLDIDEGEIKWQECIESCDQIINSGIYSLELNYFDNFSVNNIGSSENIFVIPTDPDKMLNKNKIGRYTLHFNNAKSYQGMEGGGYNGICGLPSFINSYNENDIRKQMWLSGVQLSIDGDTLLCTMGQQAGQPLNYVNEMDDIEYVLEAQGLRIAKFDYTGYRRNTTEGDIPIFRYSDVLLMKAEALMRQNGGIATENALELVNLVRERASLLPLTMNELTLEALLKERGHELALEGYRRNDLIRFGKWIQPFYEGSTIKNIEKKVIGQKYVRLLPIPDQQINANPNLTQNPGY